MSWSSPIRRLAGAMQILCLICAFSCVPSPRSGADDARANAERVALAALIVNPERYDGSEVLVTSWGVVSQEGAALYLSESDHRHVVTEAGVWLELPAEPAFRARRVGYMTVRGRFRIGDEIRGYAGRITDIEDAVMLEPEVTKE